MRRRADGGAGGVAVVVVVAAAFVGILGFVAHDSEKNELESTEEM